MEIEHYTNNTGNTPTLKYLDNLKDAMHSRKIIETIERLNKFELQRFLDSADIEKIKGTKQAIWELKISCKNNTIYRVLFEVTDNKIIFLNIFNKKQQRIRRAEIAKAISRLK